MAWADKALCEMNELQTNRCVMCGEACSFLAMCEGLCLHCGDQLQRQPIHLLLSGFAKACLRVKELEAIVRRLEAREP